MKELLETIDNWTLIKLIGGLSIIISSIISFTAYFIKDYFINKWKLKYQLEIERLKGQQSQNNSLLSNLTNSISNIYLASNEKRVQYLEKVWLNMLEFKNQLPFELIFYYSYLYKDEIININSDKNKFIRDGLSKYKIEEIVNLIKNSLVELEKCRPFIGDNIWLVLNTYHTFLGRLAFLLFDGIKQGKVNYWKDDNEFVIPLLSTVITHEELNRLLESEIKSFRNVVNFLEQKAIIDINEQLSGKRMSEKTVEQALKLSELTNEKLEKLKYNNQSR